MPLVDGTDSREDLHCTVSLCDVAYSLVGLEMKSRTK